MSREQERRVRMAEFQVLVAKAALQCELTVGESMASLAGMLVWDAERYVLSGEVPAAKSDDCDCFGFHQPSCPHYGDTE